MWGGVMRNDCYDIGLIFMSFGINPNGFKKKRHAKKFFKKYILPVLKKEEKNSVTADVV